MGKRGARGIDGLIATELAAEYVPVALLLRPPNLVLVLVLQESLLAI